MTILEIEKAHQSANQCIGNAEVMNAFGFIKQLADELGRGDVNDELERLRISYTFMLKYLEQVLLMIHGYLNKCIKLQLLLIQIKEKYMKKQIINIMLEDVWVLLVQLMLK